MDAEAVRYALAAELETQDFKDVLKTIWLEKGARADEVIYPVEISPVTRMSPQQFPCGEVNVGPGRIQNAETDGMVDFIYTATIFWIVNGSDELEITNQVSRLLRATQDYFKARPNLLVGTIASVWLGDEDYSPFVSWMGQSSTPFVRAGSQDLRIRVIR